MSHVPVSRLQELVVRPPGARWPGAQLTSHWTRSWVTRPHSRPVTARVTRPLSSEDRGRSEWNVTYLGRPV